MPVHQSGGLRNVGADEMEADRQEIPLHDPGTTLIGAGVRKRDLRASDVQRSHNRKARYAQS